MRYWVAIAMLVILPNWVEAASYTLLTDLGSSAEMISRGNVEGFSQSSNSLFENPAGLAKIKQYSASFFTTSIMQEVNYLNFSFAYNSGGGVYSVGYMSSGVAGIPSTKVDDAGLFYQDGSFSYASNLMKFGYGYGYSDDLDLGASATLYNTQIATVMGSGYGIDVGALYKTASAIFSLTLRNALAQKVTYKDSADPSYTGSETIPMQTVLGMQYPMGDSKLYGQFKLDGQHSLISMGISYNPRFLDSITLSAGYKEFSVLRDVKNTLTMGASLNLSGIHLDYAYEKSDYYEQDSNSYFSMSFNM